MNDVTKLYQEIEKLYQKLKLMEAGQAALATVVQASLPTAMANRTFLNDLKNVHNVYVQAWKVHPVDDDFKDRYNKTLQTLLPEQYRQFVQ